MPEGLPLAALGEVVAALALAVAASLLVGRLLQPQRRVLPRRGAGLALHLGLTTLAYSLLLGLAQRPWFAAALAAAGALLLVLVSNAKYRALREPFVYTDFGLFSQALRHPRLYLPFLGVLPALAGAAAVTAALALGLLLEPALPGRIGTASFAALLLALALPALGVVAFATRRAGPLQLEPARDLAAFGLLPSLWLYWRAEHGHVVDPAAHFQFNAAARPAGAGARPSGLPHLVVVQSESFFDVRRVWPDIQPGLLGHFDRLRGEALLHGRLQVPAWGANTMRTEFAFLSGLGAAALGPHRFNPYRRLARQPLPSIASRLRDAGYRSLCLHPHPASFFARHRVMPALGFDDFLDLAAFAGAARVGPYIGDAAVGAKILELLQEAEQPTFIYAITMENHGPLHLERVAPGDVERLYRRPPPAGCDDLTIYLRHLGNADRMLGALSDALRTHHPEALLCWFGDHVPSMPAVYAATGFDDGRSDYLVWSPGGHGGPALDTTAERLGGLVLERLFSAPAAADGRAAGPTGP
jgi:hypothetical protein